MVEVPQFIWQLAAGRGAMNAGKALKTWARAELQESVDTVVMGVIVQRKSRNVVSGKAAPFSSSGLSHCPQHPREYLWST